MIHWLLSSHLLVYTYFDSDKSKQNASTYFICNCGHLIVVSPFVCLIWGWGSESTTNGNLASKSCASTWTSDLLRRWLPKPRTTQQIGHEGCNLNHQNKILPMIWRETELCYLSSKKLLLLICYKKLYLTLSSSFFWQISAVPGKNGHDPVPKECFQNYSRKMKLS